MIAQVPENRYQNDFLLKFFTEFHFLGLKLSIRLKPQASFIFDYISKTFQFLNKNSNMKMPMSV